jgi:hypothetical protein
MPLHWVMLLRLVMTLRQNNSNSLNVVHFGMKKAFHFPLFWYLPECSSLVYSDFQSGICVLVDEHSTGTLNETNKLHARPGSRQSVRP